MVRSNTVRAIESMSRLAPVLQKDLESILSYIQNRSDNLPAYKQVILRVLDIVITLKGGAKILTDSDDPKMSKHGQAMLTALQMVEYQLFKANSESKARELPGLIQSLKTCMALLEQDSVQMDKAA